MFTDGLGTYIVCGWCGKPGVKLYSLKAPNSPARSFCSEQCFTQCRRATFKKSKVCDWCKHIRHTVNYVDFSVSAEDVRFGLKVGGIVGKRVKLSYFD